MAHTKKRQTAVVAPVEPGPNFRSGAVARMAGMPVATLRIWEQRYQVVQPTTALSGHRLYSAADLQRVLLLRQLSQQGHAIGSIARLDSAQLQAVADQHFDTAAAAGARPAHRAAHRARPSAAQRLVVVGRALAARLQRSAVLQRLERPVQVVVFESLAEAARAAHGTVTDLLIWQCPALQAGVPTELAAAQEACHARQVAVAYRFAGAAAKKAFADTGALLLREPADDEALGEWLAAQAALLAASAVAPAPLSGPLQTVVLPAGTMAPRRFDDAALTAIAGLSPTLACECPRHVAELLMQISSFEAYSADCVNRLPGDAELHAYLHRVAGASRALFESALESVARHEGLRLP